MKPLMPKIAVVQWQDAFGDWHDVDGWRGHLDAGQGQMKI
jgi:hypothetical protein